MRYTIAIVRADGAEDVRDVEAPDLLSACLPAFRAGASYVVVRGHPDGLVAFRSSVAASDTLWRYVTSDDRGAWFVVEHAGHRKIVWQSPDGTSVDVPVDAPGVPEVVKQRVGGA